MTEPSLRTSRRRFNYLGSAHSGTGDHAKMHLTSLALIPLAIAFMVMMLRLGAHDYNGVRNYLGHPGPTILMILFIGTGILHMQIGMKAIIDDYVHDHAIKDAALIANLFFCVALGVTCLYALVRIGLA
ncbi:MAG: succinate dehydrogenase, hydrophobic membrane anchor protein [Hyphomicrobiales bacterium]|nr:succinate dehydrogenase, hydrophobic membrane anchor protein [Hyphomicrobiales bacterium]